MYFPAPGPGPRSWPPIFIYWPWHPICVCRAWPPICFYRRWPQYVFTTLGPNLCLPALAPGLCLAALAGGFVTGAEFVCAGLVSSIWIWICICLFLAGRCQVLRHLVRQLLHTMCISNNRASIHLWWKENLVKHQKVSKYESDCRKNKLKRVRTQVAAK